MAINIVSGPAKRISYSSLTCQDADTLMYLQQQAQEVTLAHFGNAIFIRGLIEVGKPMS